VTICIQKIDGECQVLYRSCAVGCEDWPLDGKPAKVAPPPGAGGVIAGEPDPDRRARLEAAYLTVVPFPECLRHPTYPMPDWMQEVLADYEDRLSEIDADEGAEDLAECTA